MARIVSKKIAPGEVIVRCLLKSYLSKSDKTQLTYSAVEPKRNEHDVSMLRLRYTDLPFCVRHGIGLTTPSTFAGLLYLTPNIIKGVNQWALSGLSVDDVDNPSDCNGIQTSIKSTPLDENGNYLPEEAVVDADVNDGSLPMHADLIYNHDNTETLGLNIRIRKYATMLKSRTQYQLSASPTGQSVEEKMYQEVMYRKYNSQPLLSIVVYFSKVNKNLLRFAESILIQVKGQPVEVIFINDGETNVNPLRDLFSQYPMESELYGQDHKGLAIARNHAVEVARSPYLWFLEPGLNLEQDAVSHIVDSLRSDSDLYAFQVSDEHGSHPNTRRCYDGDKPLVISGMDFLKSHYSYSPAPIFVVKRSLMENNHLSFADSPILDQELMPRILMATANITLIPVKTCLCHNFANYKPEQVESYLQLMGRISEEIKETESAEVKASLYLIQLRSLTHVMEDPNRNQLLSHYREWQLDKYLQIFRDILLHNRSQIRSISDYIKWVCWYIGPKFYKWVELRATKVKIW